MIEASKYVFSQELKISQAVIELNCKVLYLEES